MTYHEAIHLPLRVLCNMADEHNEVLRGYGRDAQRAVNSRNAKGRVIFALCYPAIPEHGA